MVSNQTNYAFVHIEKAAGTTFIHEIRKAFLFRYADVRPLSRRATWHLNADDVKKYQKFIPNMRFIGGHSVVPWSDLERALPNLRYVTILREPIDRLVAHYVHWCQRRAYEGTILEFAQLPFMHNFSCKKISGYDDFEASRDMLLEKFVAVGTIENISGFFEHLNLVIPEFPKIQPSNAKNKRWAAFNDQLDAETYEKLRSLNKNDIRLYDWARKYYSENLSMSENYLKSESSIMNSYSSLNPVQLADYIWRKSWVEPVSGIIRFANSLPYKGSYQFQ